MLSIFYGKDTSKSRKDLNKSLDAAMTEDANLVRFDELSVEQEAFENALAAQGLFGGKTIVVLDSVLENEEASEWILEKIEDMAESANVFFLLAGVVDAKTEKEFKKVDAKLYKAELVEGKPKEDFSLFTLADAFARRDKKSAWVLFTKARLKDMGPQEICGTLVWQMRMIVLAHTTKTATEAGVSDFPYRKAKSFTKQFDKQNAESMLSRLIGMYHFDPKENRGDLALALERLILSL